MLFGMFTQKPVAQSSNVWRASGLRLFLYRVAAHSYEAE